MNFGIRIVKQLLIALVILGVLGFAGAKITQNIRPATPTPTPDPRASLIPIEVVDTQLLEVSTRDYDVIAKIQNSNAAYGSSTVGYELSLMNAVGKEVFHKTGTFYILPGQTKYVLLSPLKTAEPVTLAIVNIVMVDWQQLDALAVQNVSLVVTGSQYTSTSSMFRGTILNNSDFDISQAEVTVILFDIAQKPIAANRTEIRTFLAKTTRGFEVSWSPPPSGDVVRAYVEATTNLFENSTFLRRYGKQEEF